MSDATEPKPVKQQIPGLTKREYFAAMALQGLLSNVVDGEMIFSSVAQEAVCYADALIYALNK